MSALEGARQEGAHRARGEASRREGVQGRWRPVRVAPSRRRHWTWLDQHRAACQQTLCQSHQVSPFTIAAI